MALIERYRELLSAKAGLPHPEIGGGAPLAKALLVLA
jgi:hypothetical protein